MMVNQDVIESWSISQTTNFFCNKAQLALTQWYSSSCRVPQKSQTWSSITYQESSDRFPWSRQQQQYMPMEKAVQSSSCSCEWWGRRRKGVLQCKQLLQIHQYLKVVKICKIEGPGLGHPRIQCILWLYERQQHYLVSTVVLRFLKM